MAELIGKLRKSLSNKSRKSNNQITRDLLIEEDDIEIKDSLKDSSGDSVKELSRSGTKKVASNNKHLICDDNPSNRTILKKYLEMCGCEVEEAVNLHEAIKKIKKNGEYNVMWVSTNMPEMEAIDCTNQLRNEMKYKGVIITLTGYMDDTTEQECIKAGVNHVLCKPFNKDVIEMYTNKYH